MTALAIALTMQASPPQIDELLLDFVGLSFITDLDQMIRIARNAAIGPLTMGDPRLGQRETPVTDARGIVEIIMILPGHQATLVRRQAAELLVRYLGGGHAHN